MLPHILTPMFTAVGHYLTGFSDTEETAVHLTKVVPFLLEDELKKKAAITAKGPTGEFTCKRTDC